MCVFRQLLFSCPLRCFFSFVLFCFRHPIASLLPLILLGRIKLCIQLEGSVCLPFFLFTRFFFLFFLFFPLLFCVSSS
ncbi:hypothetical protein BKA57DRAFT_190790 [Linnemannia elongata]|nr:hypothetical protein BKA57DRAFT_190790 [Linnemannia elongata]